ncbi:MAG: right-handed parallel beta-helix repeat-containing protein, partial [Deltaproteobacteria bacterium]|nr:right-handed parallel beta-helix repeat-containing protein [Deltaproteobacteria bacterium]
MPDSASDAGLAACVHVDGRGGSAADGSASAPFATIDDAIAAGAERICLGAGFYAPPTSTVTRPLRIEGVTADPERPDRTSIDGSLGSCLSVTVPAFVPGDTPQRGDAVLAVASAGELDLLNLRLANCDLGVAVDAGALRAEGVRMDGILGGVAVYAAGSASLVDMQIAANTRPARPDSPRPVGALALGGADLRVVGGAIHGRRLSSGVVAIASAIHLEGLIIDGGLFGFLSKQGVGSDMLSEIGPDVLVRGLRSTPGDPTGIIPANVIIGGRASVTGVRFADIEGDCLQLQRLDHVVLSDLRFEGCALGGLELYSADADLSGDSQFDLPAGAAGIFLSDHIGDGLERAASALRVNGDVMSVATGRAFHVISVSSTLRFESGSLDLAGGQTALSALNGASVEVLAGARVHDLRAGASLADPSSAVFVAGDGSSFRGADLDLDLGPPGGIVFGVLAGDTGRVELSNGTIRGGDTGLLMTGDVILSADGVEIDSANFNGIAIFGGTATVHDARVHDGAGVGVLVREGATLSLDRGMISNNGGSGVEAQAGARLEIRGSTFEANMGASVAFYDASGFVASSMFSVGSTLGDFGGERRADEIRMVSTDGAVHEVFIGDDGDGTVMPDEENRFELEARAGCDGGGCTLLLGDGAGLNGVVQPNCVVASAPGGAVHTV